MLAALAERRAATGSTEYDNTIARSVISWCRCNATTVTSTSPTTRRRGRPTGSPSPSTTRAKRCGHSPGCRTRSRRLVPHRRVARRALVSTERNDRDFVPVGPLNDHWAAHTFAEMASWPIGDAEAAYARSLAGRFAALTRWEAQKDSGAPYSWTHGPPRRAAALGTWVEGQAALATSPAPITGSRTCATTRGQRGVRRGSAHRPSARRQRPAHRGAWFDSGQSRIDDEQHPISGLLGLADLLEPEQPEPEKP